MDWQCHLLDYHARATLLALLVYLVGYVFVRFRLGCGYWVRIAMIAYGLLNFRHCCALRLEGNYLTLPYLIRARLE